MDPEFCIRVMQQEDLLPAQALSRGTGWNQTLVDWKRLLDLTPGGCFVCSRADTTIGTVTTTAYGPTLGWIGMLLVEPAYRKRGIASALLTEAINHLKQRKIQSIG